MKKAIIIMAKVPHAGKVKTRMQPFLIENQSETLATAFLKDIEKKTANINSIIAFSPANLKSKLTAMLQYEHILIEQEGINLGERMFNAFTIAFRNSFESVVMIGTDSPNLPKKYINTAFEYLENEAEIVLGKSEDGGFYLIGLNSVDQQLFHNVEWSSENTFMQTKRNALKLKLKLKTLPIWFDVDLPNDLKRLKKELAENPECAIHTHEWLKEFLPDKMS